MNDMNKRTFLSLLLCVCSLSFLHAERVDMQQAGADIQGRKLNTALINSTIDRLNANGGGTLFFPAGTYLTGSIHMKSNITLELLCKPLHKSSYANKFIMQSDLN